MSNSVVKNRQSLFLDRDGVINKRIMGGYITRADDFEFLPGVLEAIRLLSEHFAHVFIVTNQQGIGKGLMTEEKLEEIHQAMQSQIEYAGGRIDKIYFCPDLASKEPNCRKPGIQMALQAKQDFPDINFTQSIMVGDTLSDMEFGENAGMQCVLISDSKEAKYATFTSLLNFANSLKNTK